MTPRQHRIVRVAVETVSFDVVLTATADTGVAKIGGRATVQLADPASLPHDLGPIDVTLWGSTPAQLKSRAKTWPERFDAIPADYFGVSTSDEHRFDIFLASHRFLSLVQLLQTAPTGHLAIHCDVSADGRLDLVSQVEFSGSR